MKNTITIIALLLLMLSCGESEKDQLQQEEAESTERVEPEKTITNDSIIQCTGEISVRPEFEVSIHSPVGGLIKSIHIMEGEQVTKGDILATIEHLSIIQLQEDYLAAKSEYEHAKKNYDRKSKLFEQSIISEKEFDQAEQLYQSTFAHFEGLNSQVSFLDLSLNKLNEGRIQKSIPILSPIDGSVTNVAVKNGQFAAQDTELFGLIDDSHKHIHLKVFAGDAGKLQKGQTIWLKTADSDKRYEAEVFLIGKNIEFGTNTIAVHGHLRQEESELVVGTFVFAEISIE